VDLDEALEALEMRSRRATPSDKAAK